ncbi:MAG: YbhB/YbcL family Raf kinase inhibitor-like protein [Gemmatimonadota bacterium]
MSSTRFSALLAAAGALLIAPACSPDAAPVTEEPAGGGAPAAEAPATGATEGLTLTSTSFQEGTSIPLRNSAYGDEVTPDLSWSNLPEGTQSLALILDDPDDGATPYVHWVLYNIPPEAGGLPEGLTGEGTLTEPAQIAGTTQGLNNRNNASYYGPEPRSGPAHNYRFNLYALSLEPNLPEGLGADELREAMSGNILGETTLTAPFQAPE